MKLFGGQKSCLKDPTLLVIKIGPCDGAMIILTQ